MNSLETDSRQVINLFAELTSRQQRQTYRNALRSAARILTRETQNQLKQVLGNAVNHRNRWNNKTLKSGVRVKVDREATAAKVHILGDFRLKFFELGTTERHLRRNNAARGRINASHFFSTAKQNKEAEIFSTIDNLLTQSIQRVANRNRN